MHRERRLIGVLSLGLVAAAPAVRAQGSAIVGPDTIVVVNGALRLRALLWRPARAGPHPAILFNHGNGPATISLAPHRLALGPAFAREGYVFLFLFRRGAGLSADQGRNSYDQIGSALGKRGREQASRNAIQLRLLEGDDLSDARAALRSLRAHPDVDPRRIAVMGHSFGGSLTILLAERDDSLRAAVVFGAAAGSWDRSPALRARLRRAVRTPVPLMLLHAENDYSVNPGKELAEVRRRLARPYLLRIYPPVGSTIEEGHDLIYRARRAWEPDVFAFLREHMGAPTSPPR